MLVSASSVSRSPDSTSGLLKWGQNWGRRRMLTVTILVETDICIYLEYLSGQLFKVVRRTKCSVNSAYSGVMWCAGTRGHFTTISIGDIFRDTGVKQVTKDIFDWFGCNIQY